MHILNFYNLLFIRPIPLNAHLRNFIFSFFVLSILSSFCLLLPVRNHNILAVFSESKYDYNIQGINQKQFEEISEMKCVDEAFPYSIISSYIQIGQRNTEITALACESLDHLEYSNFPNKLIISESEKYLHENNQIMIDYKLAKEQNLWIGSKVYMPFGSDMQMIEFVVSRIYEPHQVYGRYDVLILWAGKHREIYEKNFDNEIGYSCAFVKTNDSDAFKNFLETEYIPQGLIKDEGQVDGEEIRKNINNLYENRHVRLAAEKKMLQYTPPIVAITSILGGIVFLIFVCREQGKKISSFFKNIAIFNLLGVSKSNISICCIIDSLLIQIPSLIISTFAVKYIIFNGLGSSNFLPLKMQFDALIIELVGIVLISLIYGFFTLRKLKKSNIPDILSRE